MRGRRDGGGFSDCIFPGSFFLEPIWLSSADLYHLSFVQGNLKDIHIGLVLVLELELLELC